VGSLTTDAGGRTVVRGGSVQAPGGQSYGDDVLLGVSSGLGTAAGNLSFLGRVDAEAAGAQGLTVAAPAGTLLFAGAVGSAGPVGFLTADAVQTTFAAVFRAAGDVTLTARGGGVEQTGGSLTAADLSLFGTGTFNLDQLGTSAAGNDIAGTFQANVAGPIQLADRNDLTVGAAGIVSTNSAVSIRTGQGFTAAGSGTLVNVGAAEFVVEPGQFGPARVKLDAEIVAVKARFGVAGDTGPNSDADSFDILPSANTPIEVNGNAPKSLFQDRAIATVSGDQLNPDLKGLTVTDFTYNGQDGFYKFAERQPLTFTGIERLEQFGLAGFVVQTAEPGDANNAAQVNYAVRIVQTQRGVPLPGGLDGKALPQNPFVVSPSFVNPAAPNAAPRVAFGDVNGDGRVDVVLANGPGTAPLVTVIDGQVALNPGKVDKFPNLDTLQGTPAILAQFFAYDPRFFGGVNVAVADLTGDGKAEIITGADIGGGPHVRVFDGVTVKGNADPREVDGFFAYEPTFKGGVRVAAGDVNGDGQPDLVLGAGVGGGPRVTVVDGKQVAERQGGAARGSAARGVNPAAVLANFFAYDTAFRGGIFVDAGDFDNDGFADVLTGPGVGGGPHVRVFDGKTAPTGSPTVLANFIALDPPPDPLFGVTAPQNGVGGVAFTGRGNNGLRNVVVGSARGTLVQVIEYEFTPGQPAPTRQAAVLEPSGRFIVQNVSTADPTPAIDPLPVQLGYGATVGGFLDESDG
ncbi:MAG TPA: hypothetical protein VFG68_18295, partial [Fimbriiglobus sp.]|nr:hypothetical protein [Fimbriiglobus sp.]